MIGAGSVRDFVLFAFEIALICAAPDEMPARFADRVCRPESVEANTWIRMFCPRCEIIARPVCDRLMSRLGRWHVEKHVTHLTLSNPANARECTA